MPFSGIPSQAKNLELTEQSWQSAASGRSVPFRGNMNRLDNNYQFLIQRSNSSAARIRLAGLYFEALFGACLAGREFSSLFAHSQRDVLQDDLSQVFEEPAKAFIHTMAESQFVEFALFPVSNDFGPIEYALGALNLEQQPEKSVTHLNIQSVEKISLHEAKTELKYGFAEDRVGFGGAPKNKFRVIEGGGQSEAREHPSFQVIKHIKREP